MILIDYLKQVFSLLFLSVGLGFELRVSNLQSSCSSASATHPTHFALVILEMESLKLFAQVTLKP
jgi:hypothetical protein